MGNSGAESSPISSNQIKEVLGQDLRLAVAFDDPEIEIDDINSSLYGGKGANLMKMVRLGLPVPPGFNLTTHAAQAFHEKNSIPFEVWEEIKSQLSVLEQKVGKKFGDPENPLILSARSGGVVSLPGLLTTIVDIGINDETVEGLAKQTSEWCAWDSYRRAIESYAASVGRRGDGELEPVMEYFRKKYYVSTNQELPVEALKKIVGIYKRTINYPQGLSLQLRNSIEAVFRSWHQPSVANLVDPEIFELGTPVNIQEMVFGNQSDSGSGILYTRDTQTFRPYPMLAVSAETQGVDNVGELSQDIFFPIEILKPSIRDPLIKYGLQLEEYFIRPQEIEFTYVGDKLYLLQTRNAHFAPLAKLNRLLFGYSQKQVTELELVLGLKELIFLHGLSALTQLDPAGIQKAEEEGRFIDRGVCISPGAVVGYAASSFTEAEKLAKENKPVILVVNRLKKNDPLRLPPYIVGIISAQGGAGSHISELIKSIGIPTIFGVQEVSEINSEEAITINATEGLVFRGEIPLAEQLFTEELTALSNNVLEEYQTNPWLLISRDQPLFNAAIGKTGECCENLLSESPKAIAIELAQLIPPEDRIDYQVFPKGQIKEIKEAILQGLQRGEVSLRSCYYHENSNKLTVVQGREPWCRLTNDKEIKPFFQDIFPNWQTLEGCLLTEVIVGKNPKEKLNPEFARQHCVFTICCTPTAVVVEIIPYTFQLRAFDDEKISLKDMVALTIPLDPQSPTGLAEANVHLGKNLDKEAKKFVQLVAESIERWWQEWPIPLPYLMASLTQVAELNTIEGQARVSPEGKNWCKVYGFKGPES